MVKGQLSYKNGDKYYGQIKNNQLSGQGVYKFADGSLYEGYFQNNQFNGHGKLVDNFTSKTLIGNFKKGKANGKGKIIYQDQSIYQGQLLQGMRNGQGNYIYSSKQPQKQYKGQFKNDAFQGQGILQFKDGTIYKGIFKDNMLNGIGLFKNIQYSINGEFKDNLPHGKCVVIYLNHDKYQGDYVQGQKSGFGTYIYKDGSRYTGKFKNDLKQGLGQLFMSSGQYFKGYFLEDQPIEGQILKQNWTQSGKLKNNQFEGLCTIRKEKIKIYGNFSQGKKDGIFTVIKQCSKGNEISYKGQFKNDKQNPYSVTYSQRF